MWTTTSYQRKERPAAALQLGVEDIREDKHGGFVNAAAIEGIWTHLARTFPPA
jgi:hypothetical protein